MTWDETRWVVATILQAAAVYLFLLVMLRVAGRRTLGEMTAFDFVLLLVVSEATESAMLGEDQSLTNAALAIAALIGLDVAFSLAKRRWKALDHLIEGVPTILVENGRALHDQMDRARVDVDDVLKAARKQQGLERIDQIKYAVLESDGAISIIPRQGTSEA